MAMVDWGEPWFEALKPVAKLVYLYLATTDRQSRTGAFPVSIRALCHATGLDEPRAESAMKELVGTGHVAHWPESDWVFVAAVYAHQRANSSWKFARAAATAALSLPAAVREHVVAAHPELAEYVKALMAPPAPPPPDPVHSPSIPYPYPMDTLSGRVSDTLSIPYPIPSPIPSRYPIEPRARGRASRNPESTESSFDVDSESPVDGDPEETKYESPGTHTHTGGRGGSGGAGGVASREGTLRQATPVAERGRGRQRHTYSAPFEAFWAPYPPQGKASKVDAYRAWVALGGDQIAGQIMAGLDRWAASRRWAEGFVKDAGPFLRARMFDEWPPSATAQASGNYSNAPPGSNGRHGPAKSGSLTVIMGAIQKQAKKYGGTGGNDDGRTESDLGTVGGGVSSGDEHALSHLPQPSTG